MAGEPESLDSDEPLAKRRERHDFDRLIMLSDGVFAISLTLLAFGLKPAGAMTSLASVWRGIAPQLDAYALSVIVIGVFWLAHKRFMAMILKADAPLVVINLFILCLIALIPSGTRFAHFGAGPGMALYGALIAAIGLAEGAFWGWAMAAKLISPEVPARLRWFFLALIVIVPPFFLLITEIFRRPAPGVIPLVLLALFLVGWRLRLWTTARLAGAPASLPTPTPAPAPSPDPARARTPAEVQDRA
ncbi:MAG: TMEM175 family protein [Caulobacteraceae bacterium]